ncbi:hypothetical protein Daus18300_001265 [Diaporthe australafricana]|uniref:RGS domain-containing protein n=1 Tax=Diaporthe australafricana TaxID=127596 RepID=A0ABR3XXB5_9PEZI
MPIPLDDFSANSRSPTPAQSSSGASSFTDNQSVDGSASSGGTSVTTGGNSSVVTMDEEVRSFISMLVFKSSRYALVSIEVTKMNARDFFRDLVKRYHKERGLLRRVFSIFIYSHCEFVKVKRHRAYRFAPMPGFSVPRPHDDEYPAYQYGPQPMEEAPITEHVFNDLFYACYNSDSVAHRFHSLFMSGCDVAHDLPEDLLENIPKYDREVLAGTRFSKVENFWGIAAQEQRSAIRVLAYMLLSLSPTVWFIFAWLFSWGHAGDLQTATVPTTVSLATLSMVWVVVYSGSGVKRET